MNENLSASLILATYEMPRHLELVLAGLKRQTARNYEIFLCDDGSGEKTRNVAQKFANYTDVPFEHLWQENKGFRKSRILNQAIRKAKGDLLIFLDGDCIPHQNFIEDHILSFESGTYQCGRRVELGPEFSKHLTSEDVEAGLLDGPSFKLWMSCMKNDSEHFQRTLRVTQPLLRKILKMDHVIDLKGCNYSVSRNDLIAINGYDESYEGYGREDTDVEIRLKNLGLKIRSLKGRALQFHVWHPRREFTPKNDKRLEKLIANRKVRCDNGLT